MTTRPDYGFEPKLPSIPAPNDSNLKDVVAALREAIQVRVGAVGDGMDRAVTLRDLLNSGLAEPLDLRNLGSGGITPPPLGGGNNDPDIPPTPEHLVASGAIKYIILTWDFARGYSRLAFFEVWRSLTDNIADAILIGQTFAPIYADNVGPGKSYYYWVRAVSDAANSPFNALSGTLGQTAIDPAYIIEILTGQITESQLYKDLGDRITLIDAAATVAGSVAQRIKTEADARVAAILAESQDRTTYVQTYTYSKQEVDYSESLLASSVTAAYKLYTDTAKTQAIAASYADVRAYAYSQADVNGAISSVRSDTTADIATAYNNAKAFTQSYTYSQVEVNQALAGQLSTITTEYKAYADAAKTQAISVAAADVRSYSFSQSDTTAAIAQTADQLRAEFTSNSGVSAAYVMNYAFSKAETGSAISNAVSTVSSRVDNHDLSIQSNTTSINGLKGTIAVKIDNNGYVSGYGLASDYSNGVATSSFIIRSDSFAIGSPSGPGIAPSLPFIVRTTVSTINGVTVPIGAYLADAYIANGTITNAKIGNLQVDDAKIANLSVGKLTAGKLGVGEYIESTNFLSGDTGFRVHGNGNAEFYNCVVRGTVFASAGEIGQCIIDNLSIHSPGYVYDVQGWNINRFGDAYFNNARIRGQLVAAYGTLGIITAATIQSAASGARSVMTETGFRCYDGVLGLPRAEMGLLS